MRVGEIWKRKRGVTRLELIAYQGMDLWICVQYMCNAKVIDDEGNSWLEYTGQEIYRDFYKVEE